MPCVRLLLLTTVSVIFAIGLVMIFNTSSAEVLDMALKRSVHQGLMKQLTYACLGLGLGAAVYGVGYQTLLRLSSPLFYFLTFLLLLVLIPGIGIQANGSRRWLGFGGYSIQPSEFMKIVLPLYFIQRMLTGSPSQVTWLQFVKLLGVVGIPVVLILLEPNNGTAAMMCLSLVALFVLTGIRTKYWALPMALVLSLGGMVALNVPYVSARVNVYLNPEVDLKGKGHQPHQAKIAAGSGGVFGKGPGKSLQKLSYLPEAQNDYIAAIYGEEFGFVGMCALIFLYMLLGYLGFHIASMAVDRGGCYLGAAITFVMCFQAFLNLGVVSGLLPSTGLNLPFFSQGGTSLLANLLALGVLLSIQAKTLQQERYEVVHHGL